MRKGSECKACPAQYDPCLWRGHGDQPAHIIVVGPSPSGFSIGKGMPFFGRYGRLFKQLLNIVRAHDGGRYVETKVFYTYAARVGAYKPKKGHIESCNPVLMRELDGIDGVNGVPPVIVPLGPVAAKAVGLKFRKIGNVVGREFTLPFPSSRPENMDGRVRRLSVIPLLSMQHLSAKPGTSNVVVSALHKAVGIAHGNRPSAIDLDEVTKDYEYPKTLEEVDDLVTRIVNYYDPARGQGSQDWAISLDTETNTLKPYSHPDPKILMISVGWDTGKAATILLDHPEVPYDPKEAWKIVERLLTCQKPKIFHNWKFDMKFLENVYGYRVNRVAWDTMLGEHYIDEDKKGFYSLKQLTPLYASSYEGYDDDLQDLLRGEEDQDVDEDEDGDAAATVADLHLKNDEILDRELVLGCPPDRDESQWQTLVTAVKKYEEIKETPAKKRSTYEQDQFKEKKKEISALRKELAVKVPRKPKKDAEAKKDGDGGFEKIPLETILVYAAVDADVTRIILRAQTNRLHRTDSWSDARDVMRYLYVPGSYTLSNMEYRGFTMNMEYLEELYTDLTEQMNTAKEEIASRFDPTLNLNAPQQIASYMSRLQFDAIPGEDTASTNKDLLSQYEGMYEADDPRRIFVTQLLAYREAHKALSTYIKPYRRMTKADGKIHCRFHLNGTATGRLSSADPNLQNVPLIVCRKEVGDEVLHPGFNVKRLFVPSRPDYIIVDCDIKGAELRVYTAYSRDAAMIAALNKGMDVHSLVTSKAYKMPYEEVQARKEEPEIKKKRTNCKRTVFGTFYGAGPYKIMQQIDSTKEYAEWLQNFLFTEFPELRAYVSEVEHEVRTNREVKTFFGRRRRFQLAHVSSKLMNDALREAVNFKIQSTSSDLVVSQLCEMDEHFADLEARMLITVHDSMVFEMPERNLHKLKPFLDHWIVDRVKEKFAWLPVPFLYDVEVGPTYGDVTKLEKYNGTAQKAG